MDDFSGETDDIMSRSISALTEAAAFEEIPDIERRCPGIRGPVEDNSPDAFQLLPWATPLVPG